MFYVNKEMNVSRNSNGTCAFFKDGDDLARLVGSFLTHGGWLAGFPLLAYEPADGSTLTDDTPAILTNRPELSGVYITPEGKEVQWSITTFKLLDLTVFKAGKPLGVLSGHRRYLAHMLAYTVARSLGLEYDHQIPHTVLECPAGREFTPWLTEVNLRENFLQTQGKRDVTPQDLLRASLKLPFHGQAYLRDTLGIPQGEAQRVDCILRVQKMYPDMAFTSTLLALSEDVYRTVNRQRLYDLLGNPDKKNILQGKKWAESDCMAFAANPTYRLENEGKPAAKAAAIAKYKDSTNPVLSKIAQAFDKGDDAVDALGRQLLPYGKAMSADVSVVLSVGTISLKGLTTDEEKLARELHKMLVSRLAKPVKGTPGAAPSEPAPGAAPTEGTPGAAPSEPAPGAAPTEGTPGAAPSVKPKAPRGAAKRNK